MFIIGDRVLASNSYHNDVGTVTDLICHTNEFEVTWDSGFTFRYDISDSYTMTLLSLAPMIANGSTIPAPPPSMVYKIPAIEKPAGITSPAANQLNSPHQGLWAWTPAHSKAENLWSKEWGGERSIGSVSYTSKANKKCECGCSAVGSPNHSIWCQLYTK